ncbi:MAG TPA: septum formation protein Maf [Crocinitomicaceae bacterium]|nr:septum formation protein Maf [Crocinitomicaceae bacterium]
MDKFKIILGSKSPRRQELIKELGFPFEIRTKEVEENYPDNLPALEVAGYLAKLKAAPLIDSLQDGEILLTSDTVVLHQKKILGKPKNKEEAFYMLRSLSGNSHEVITGVNLVSKNKEYNFSTSTTVYFSELSDEQIHYYIDNYQPFDKAGSYGIQEWIGMVGIEKIEGCFYNVMGLPVHELYKTLLNF